MRGSLLFCLAGAATSFVREPRRLALLQAMPTGKQRIAELEARPLSGHTPPGEDSVEWTPEQLAEHFGLPGCRVWCAWHKTRGYTLNDVKVVVPWDDKKPLSLARAKEEFRARALLDEEDDSGAGGLSAAARSAASTHEPNAKKSAAGRAQRLREVEIEAEAKKWSGTPQERQLTLMGGTALVPHRSVSVADWQYWKGEGAYPTTPGVPGFEPSFFYARKHSAMNRVLEREADEGMTCHEWELELFRGADKELTINRGDMAQSCQCLATAGVITNDQIGQQAIEWGFGWPLFRNGEVVKIDGAAAHAQANAWFNFCEDNQLDLWAKEISRDGDGFTVRPSNKGDAKYAYERCGRSKWDKTCFADLIVKNSWAGRPDDLPRLDTRPLDENNFQLAKIQKGAADENGHFTVTTLCYIERAGRNAVVHLPATRHGLLPLKRITEEERIETLGRFREFAEARNDDAKLKQLARGVMVHPSRVNQKRGRGPGQNYGIIVTRDSPESVARALWTNMFNPEGARATKIIQDFLDDIYALMAEFFPAAHHAALRRDPKFVEMALRGVIDDESEYEPNYDELPTILKSLTFNDDVAKSFTAFGKVLRDRCITLRKEHPGCITWPPGPTPPGPGPGPGGGGGGGGVGGDPLDGIDAGDIHPGHDMSPDEVWNF
ncbi:unnamed protein product [Pelagomonas calceolata]|uniref:Uncharacterized protein n=1 Tax=Pelagomonas calceolata TaxID=35677 RepID=A0A8J2WWN7_9STRA|nr:unnamed protein product [Pelagomonas calceolata]